MSGGGWEVVRRCAKAAAPMLTPVRTRPAFTTRSQGRLPPVGDERCRRQVLPGWRQDDGEAAATHLWCAQAACSRHVLAGSPLHHALLLPIQRPDCCALQIQRPMLIELHPLYRGNKSKCQASCNVARLDLSRASS